MSRIAWTGSLYQQGLALLRLFVNLAASESCALRSLPAALAAGEVSAITCPEFVAVLRIEYSARNFGLVYLAMLRSAQEWMRPLHMRGAASPYLNLNAT